MTNLTKKTLPVYLRADQLAALRALAEREQLSMAELIRQGVDRLLTTVPLEEDPLLNIIGFGDSGMTDLAENHDFKADDSPSESLCRRKS